MVRDVFPVDVLEDFFKISGEGVIEINTKHFVKCKRYDPLLRHMIDTIDDVLKTNPLYDLKIDMKESKMSEVHLSFFRDLVKMMLELYSDTLNRCYIHNNPAFFKGIYTALKPVIPKETREKIVFVKKN